MSLHLGCKVVLGVLGVAVKGLLLVSNIFAAAGALGLAQCGCSGACNCLVKASSSSLRALSCWRFGSNFFCKSAILRWPSLVCGHGHLEGDDRNLAGTADAAVPAWSRRCLCGGAQDKPEASETASATKRFI